MRRMIPDRSRLTTQPRGLVLIAVMVCLALFVLLGGVLMKLALTEQRQARVEERRAQVQWIAESCVERAVARLAESAEYSGETWQVPAAQLDADDRCSVRIEVERDPARERARLVRVVAEFETNGQRVVRRTKEIKLELNSN